MTVRNATSADIGAIVKLLKLSLGESLMPKSEAYWRWKHIDNPFGASPVLVAEEGGDLIGVRAFLRWEWTDGLDTFRTLRAVDTATHPEHQGKGIFKSLTMQLIATSDAHFIFNTPNRQSMPGYLKMGWEEAGRLPLKVTVTSPVRLVWRALTRSASTEALPDNTLSNALNHSGLKELLAVPAAISGIIHTVPSEAYLRWRYSEVPVACYHACTYEQGVALNAMLIYRIKLSRLGKELRITDIFAKSSQDATGLWPGLKDCIRRHQVDYVTVTGANNLFSVIPKSFFSKYLKGPIVTVRGLKGEVNQLKGFRKWHPSIGDLELF